ncbi:MAG: hypothetical protein JRF06_05810 [Deltaproteobacteria bacterium]|nr:hypothetical protein [Deltaproteobacteria bacterium]
MMRDLCESNLRDLSYFLRTIEKFIDDGEHTETEEIVRRYKDRAVDWSEEHPWWWQGVLGVQLRQSFIVSLISAAENHVRYVCESVRTICKLPLSLKHLKGGWIQSSRRLLINLAGFSSPHESSWEKLGGIYLIRNVIVHSGGRIEEPKRIEKLQKNAPGISVEGSFLAIDSEFCEFAHDAVKGFFEQLHDQYRERCRELSQDIV